MRADTSSPGVSGPQCGQRRRGLTTRDGVRQGRQGAPLLPGPEVKVPLRSWGLRAGKGRRRRPNLIHTEGISD
jgi:hypothetical protein